MKAIFPPKITTPLTTLIMLFFLMTLAQNPQMFSTAGEDQITVADTENTEALTIDPEAQYPVVRMVDGDTVVIDINGREEKVRYIGVDSPESVHPSTGENTEFGNTASAFTKDLEGKSISLKLDVEKRDCFGRLLAYVYPDGEMFNFTLVRQGYATVYTCPPNVKYVEDFTAAQQAAREEGIGLWKVF